MQPQWTTDGKRLICLHGSPRETGDLIVAKADGSGEPVQLTDTTPINLTHAVMPKRIVWKSADGREIAGMLHVPPGDHARNSLPLVEWVHGGPEGQDSFRGDSWAQYLQ
jgi:dipeptidyl aminopeptidase/acylaminoacyl peptidase